MEVKKDALKRGGTKLELRIRTGNRRRAGVWIEVWEKKSTQPRP